MQILQGSRGSGKTTSLIKASALAWIPIVTRNLAHSRRLTGTAQEMGFKIPEPLLYDDIISRSGRRDGTRDTKVMVDDLDAFLDYATHPAIEIVSATLTPAYHGGVDWRQVHLKDQGDIRSIFELMSEKY